MPFVGCCALVYFWTLRFSRIGDFYTLRLGFFGNLDLRIINAVEGKDFDMIATLQTVSATEGIYAINNTGSSFVNNSRDIAPFECYVICKQGSTDAPDSFDLPAKLPTAIDNETVTGSKIYTADGNLVIISNEPTEIAVYNITGQMVLMQKVEAGKTIVNDIPHGVYIVNGQKIIL